MNRVCEQCRFFDGPGMPEQTGFCRRYAPRPLATNEEANEWTRDWPYVYLTDWCGEWEQAEDPDFREVE